MADIPASSSPRTPVATAYLWAVDGAAAGIQQFDAVLSEEHERDAEVTDHSVEQGVAITDHVRPEPDRLTLEVFVSNTPVYSADAVLQAVVLNVASPTDAAGLPGRMRGTCKGRTATTPSAPRASTPRRSIPTSTPSGERPTTSATATSASPAGATPQRS